MLVCPLILSLCLAIPAFAQSTNTVGPPGKNLSDQLVAAATRGDLELLKELLRRGADVNGTNSYGGRALRAAISGNHCNAADLLLESGATLEQKGDATRNPLHLAAGRGYKDIVELLLNRGADVNAGIESGNTPLFDAAGMGLTEIVDLLIGKGAASTRRGRGD